ncbi:MAG: hypothetical protein ABI026_04490 [Gemmatimonadaceae bacterium]
MESAATGHDSWVPARVRSTWRPIDMAKILVFTGSFVGGTIGWWLGAFAGTMTAFVISMIGTAVGVYIGRRIASEFI